LGNSAKRQQAAALRKRSQEFQLLNNISRTGATRMKFEKISCAGLGAMFVCVILLQWHGFAVEKDGGFVAYPGVSGTSGPVLFSHKTHGLRGAGYACEKCHISASTQTPNVAMEGIRQKRACGSCHDGKTKGPRSQKAAASVQDCSSCHMPAADIVITLNRMDPVTFSHTRHLAVNPNKKTLKPSGFPCSECHPAPFERVSRGPVGMEVPHDSGGCAQCHNGKKRADGMPPVFAANTRCLTCHKPGVEPAKDAQK
jgi:c(7)-type cytochrome triheme protein